MTGDEFRAIRKALGLTQVRLGDQLDMTDRQIRHFETRDRPVPRVVALAIAQLKTKQHSENNGGDDGQ